MLPRQNTAHYCLDLLAILMATGLIRRQSLPVNWRMLECKDQRHCMEVVEHVAVEQHVDRNPPLSYQTETFHAGYDPRYSDPIGHTLYACASYTFYKPQLKR